MNHIRCDLPAGAVHLATPDAGARDLGDLRVADVMLRHPTVLPSTATLSRALEVFASTHVHMVVLTETGHVGSRLTGTLLRTDLPAIAPPKVPATLTAATSARLNGRTIHAEISAQQALRHLNQAGRRRAAVTDDHGSLVGLLCVKRHRQGFCSDADVAARAGDGVRSCVHTSLRRHLPAPTPADESASDRTVS